MNDPNATERNKRSVFGALFAAIFDERAGDLFVVLRNGERLPEHLDGTDLDVSTLPGVELRDVYAHLVAAGRRVGWTPICVSRLPHVIGMALLGAGADGKTQALHFDIFHGITYRNLPLCSRELLYSESFTENRVRHLSERGRVLATVAHHMAWNGYLSKQKYRDEFAAILARPVDRAWITARLNETFGRSVTAELTDPTRTEGLKEDFERRRREVERAVVARHVGANPMQFLSRTLPYAVSQMRVFLAPPGLVGAPGDRLPNDSQLELRLPLACEISPRAFAVGRVSAPATAPRTDNGPRYEVILKRLWKRATLWRWAVPSGFLWYQATRGRIAIVDELPPLIRLLRATALRPSWITQRKLETGD